ncbi:MAG TPA: VTT domain-containing protein [Polyangiaceae bacterium]|nr:VTT domain-containing protein [Polyangiaceae bacterium]
MNRTLKPKKVLAAYRRPLAMLAVLVGLLLLGRIVPIGAWLAALSTYLRHAGVWGAILFASFYLAGAFLFVPAAMLTSVAGYTFGVVWGTLIGIPGTAVSAFAVFWLSRTLLRGTIEHWLKNDARFLVVDHLIARFGARAIVLLRFSPVSPFSILNYAFGLTGIPKSHYLVATTLGTIPGSLFYAQLGAAAPQLGSIVEGKLPDGGYLQTVTLLLGLVLTAAVAIWLSVMAKRALAAAACAEQAVPAPPETKN